MHYTILPPRGPGLPQACWWALALLLSLLLTTQPARAQETTFTVTVASKTAEHPFFGQGSPQGYVISGQQGRELTLLRGRTYTFQMDGVPSFHPFYLTTSEVGSGAAPYNEGVTGNMASGNQTLTFTPGATTPDVLYYQCDNHARMGNRINVTNPTTASEDADLPSAFRLWGNYPNPFNPGTTVHFDLPWPADVYVEVFDTRGRRVLATPPSAFAAGEGHTLSLDARQLPSGMYLYRVHAATTRDAAVRAGHMLLVK